MHDDTMQGKSSVRDAPYIQSVDSSIAAIPIRTRRTLTQEEGTASIRSTRGDIPVGGCYQPDKSVNIDTAVISTDSNRHASRNMSPDKVLCDKEQRKKRKHTEKCHQNRRDFTPFITSCDGKMSPEAKAFTKILAGKVAKKWNASCSHVFAWVKARITIAALRATNPCIRGWRIGLF